MPFHLPSFYRSHLDLLDRRNAAAIAIAVERFRRKHGELPETLDALAPEFIGRVPDSIFNEGPFDYTRGDIKIVTKEETYTQPEEAHHVHGFEISSKDRGRRFREQVVRFVVEQ